MAALEPHSFFIRGLEASDLPYCVTGSVASGVYGETRYTKDIDLIILLKLPDVAKLRTIFPEADYYLPPAETLIFAVQQDQRGVFNIIHQDSQFKADVFVAARDPLHHWALKHRRRLMLSNDLGTWIAPPEYVILRKMEYFRESSHEKHLRDIRNMLAVTTDIDRDFIESQVTRLGLQAQWRIVLEPGPPRIPAT